MKIIATGAVVLAAMICGHALAAESSAISVSSASTATSATQAAKSEVLAWMEKAEAAAGKIQDKNGRDWALMMTAGEYAELFEVDKARAIAAKMPERMRDSILTMIPLPFARAGRIDEAVRVAEEVNTLGAWTMVVSMCSRKDVPRAIKLLEKLSDSGSGGGFAIQEIIKNQVLQGDLKGAEITLAKIKNDENREMARSWLLAGRWFLNLESAEKGWGKEKIEPDMMQWVCMNMAEMAKKKVEAGELKKAEQILAVLKGHHERARVNIALAEYYLKHNQMKEYQAAIDMAFKETSEIGDPEHNGWGNIQSASGFLDIANLQVKAGQFDAAMKTIGLADESGKAEGKIGNILGSKKGGLFEALGGKEALIGLLILANKTDEAVKMATREDGTLMPKAVPLLVEAYAAKGKEKELAAIMKLNNSPELEYQLCLAVARGAAKKAGVIPTDVDSK